LDVLHNRYRTIYVRSTLPHDLESSRVILMAAMTEIETCNIHATFNELRHDFWRFRGRTERRNDLCFSGHRNTLGDAAPMTNASSTGNRRFGIANEVHCYYRTPTPLKAINGGNP
jgi:hypothetical protein